VETKGDRRVKMDSGQSLIFARPGPSVLKFLIKKTGAEVKFSVFSDAGWMSTPPFTKVSFLTRDAQ